ncbi:MAG: trypsin-like serine protease [Halochromatium sp.]
MIGPALNSLLLWLLVMPAAFALGGGQPDSEQRHPEVLTLRGERLAGCSAVKIGSHTLLTAAHCVVDAGAGELWPAFQPGGSIKLNNAYRQENGADALTVVVAQTLLPESYRQGLAKFADYRRQRLAELSEGESALPAATLERGLRMRHHFAARYPDVALLRLRTATPSIPARAVDFTPLEAGAEVELVGFGCAGLGGSSAGSNEDSDPGFPAVRRAAWSRVIRVDAVNFYTEAGQRAAQAPSLCPGDSGGPVIHAGRVVGVHSVVYGLNARHGARSNMAVNLAPLADWAAWP